MLVGGWNFDIWYKHDCNKQVQVFFYQNVWYEVSGICDLILNINLIKDDGEIILTQPNYVKNFLSKFGFIDSKPYWTPYYLSETDGIMDT